jgi:uncharacterized membrane protein
MPSPAQSTIGNRIAPLRFILFVVLLLAAGGAGTAWLGWRHGVMVGFDVAALGFLLSCLPLLSSTDTATIRSHAAKNDTNRLLLLVITSIVMLVVLVTVWVELSSATAAKPASSALVIVTLTLAWLFSNSVYALHYAHLHYAQHEGRDRGGVDFPGRGEPDYWDFVYFAFTLGMTFQTSDVAITDRNIRRVVTAHCLAAFIFNLGILAFTINVLGGG